MLRPSVHRRSGKFGRGAKKSVQLLKRKIRVATSSRGTPQNRKEVLRVSKLNPNLTTFDSSKLKVSVYLQRDKDSLVGFAKSSKYQHHSQMKPQARNRSTRLSESEALNVRKRVTRSSIGLMHITSPLEREKQKRLNTKKFQKATIPTHCDQAVSEEKTVKLSSETVDLRRLTRSSLGRVTDSNFLKNKSPTNRLVNQPLQESDKKHIKYKKKEKEPSVAEESKPVTRSSFGSVSPTPLREKTPKSKQTVSPLPQSSQKGNAQKQTAKEKDVIQKDSKRMTRSSFGSITGSPPLMEKTNKSKLVISPLRQARVEHKLNVNEKVAHVNQRDSKQMTRSSFGSIVVSSTPAIENARKSKTLVTTPPQSARKVVGVKKTTKQKETDITENDHNRETRFRKNSIASPSELAKESEKVTGDKKKKSGNIRRDVQSSNKKSTPVSPSPNRRKEKDVVCSGSGSPSHGNQQFVLSNKVKKLADSSTPVNYFRKELENIPIDCLSATPLRNPSLRAKNNSKNTNLPQIKPLSGNRFRNSKEHKLDAKMSPERNSANKKVSKGVKRKSKDSPKTDDKRQRKSTRSTPVVNEGCLSTDCLTSNFSSKRPRRHTVDVPIKSRVTKNPSTMEQKGRKKSSIKSKASKQTKGISATPLKPERLFQQKNSNSSRSTPDTSQLPVDCLATFRPPSAINNRVITKRPKSAPGAMKRKSLVKGDKGFKTPIPTKGTLKRKRWLFNALKEKNEGYEDDIFENQNFDSPVYHMSQELDDESDTSISTPKFGFLLTPALPKKTPKYKDIISPSDLMLARKSAEEYIFRRNKNRTINNVTLTSPSSSQTNVSVTSNQVPEKKKLDFVETMDRIITIQKDMEKKTQDESEEEDAYFSDASS